jgi:hypothetical protein
LRQRDTEGGRDVPELRRRAEPGSSLDAHERVEWPDLGRSGRRAAPPPGKGSSPLQSQLSKLIDAMRVELDRRNGLTCACPCGRQRSVSPY